MALRDLLTREIVNGPIKAALAMRDAVHDDIEASLALADDPAEDASARVAVLLAIALVAQDVTLPDRAIELLEDDLLVDAAIGAGATSAITGILAAAGPRASDRIRHYLAVRLAAAGAKGLHIGDLLLSVGDLANAGRAALPTLATEVRAQAHDELAILAVASILARWTQAQPEFGERLCAALPVDVAQVLAPAARHFDAHTADLLEAVR